MTSKIPARVIDAEDSNSSDHWQGLEDPEEPFVAEGITVHAFGELADTIDAAYLIELAQFQQVTVLLTIISPLEM